ncbi:MAG: TerB family tellurite resistance protein [bacterium]|nr:TerB family tellurite resistance protein [bacterium]
MFLRNFNEQQQKAFLAIAMKIAGADGRLDPEERKMIEGMRLEMGLLSETTLPSGSIEELAQPFDTRRVQATVLLESIALAYSDNEFSGEEQKILRALALIWGISEQDATEMENWVLDYNRILAKAGEILSK